MLPGDPWPYSAQTRALQTSSFCVQDPPLALKKDPGSLKCGLLSHSRCIQCLALSKALKCKTDGAANKDQRQQAGPPGPLSSHARRCCHSESRLCSVQAYCSQPTPFPPAEGTPPPPPSSLCAPLYSVGASLWQRFTSAVYLLEPIPVVSSAPEG